MHKKTMIKTLQKVLDAYTFQLIRATNFKETSDAVTDAINDLINAIDESKIIK